MVDGLLWYNVLFQFLETHTRAYPAVYARLLHLRVRDGGGLLHRFIFDLHLGQHNVLEPANRQLASRLRLAAGVPLRSPYSLDHHVRHLVAQLGRNFPVRALCALLFHALRFLEPN